MRVVRVTDSEPGARLAQGTAPEPSPGKFELLIRVCAAGIIPTELGWYPTTHTKSGDPRLGAIPSHEFSGVVEGVAPGVTIVRPGEAVYGLCSFNRNGSAAEYLAVRADGLAPKPATLDHVAAASVPLAALTAFSFQDKIRMGNMDYFVKILKIQKTLGKGLLLVEARMVSVI